MLTVDLSHCDGFVTSPSLMEYGVVSSVRGMSGFLRVHVRARKGKP